MEKIVLRHNILKSFHGQRLYIVALPKQRDIPIFKQTNYHYYIIISPLHKVRFVVFASSRCKPSYASCSAILTKGRLTLRLPRGGLHSRMRLLQRLSVLRDVWPAHCYFNLLTFRTMSVTLVFWRIIWLQHLSLRETSSIVFSMARWATLSLLSW